MKEILEAECSERSVALAHGSRTAADAEKTAQLARARKHRAAWRPLRVDERRGRWLTSPRPTPHHRAPRTGSDCVATHSPQVPGKPRERAQPRTGEHHVPL